MLTAINKSHVGVSACLFTVHNRAICAYYKAMVSDSDPFGQKAQVCNGIRSKVPHCFISWGGKREQRGGFSWVLFGQAIIVSTRK